MDEQLQLKEALRALLTLADASDRTLQVGQVEKECASLGLDDRQIQLVCAYLEMNHVHIEGFAALEEDKSLFRDAVDLKEDQAEQKSDADGRGSAGGHRDTDSRRHTGVHGSAGGRARTDGVESAYYQMYLAELRGLQPCSEEEERALAGELLAGSETAKARLVEGNLHLVVEISKAYLGRGVLAADLVQEGNMALFMAVDSYRGGMDLRLYLVQEIERAMVEAIREQTGSDEILNTLAADANALMKATETLADRLGREATAEELAEHLHMSRERVETLVKLSLDAMNLSNE